MLSAKQIPKNIGVGVPPVVSKPTPVKEAVDNHEFVGVGLRGVLSSTEKLLAINRGLEEPDERDSYGFKHIFGVDKHLGERINLDAGKIKQGLMRNAAKTKSLRGAYPFLFDAYTKGLLLGDPGDANPLSAPGEEVNPLHILEAAYRITQMGPGGIGTSTAITTDAQNVHNSQFGFVDPIAGPECTVGDSEVYTRRGWVKWQDVVDDDQFACRINDRFAWGNASRIVRERYVGDLIVARSSNFLMRVTPNHRVLNKRGNRGALKVHTAAEVFGKAVRLPARHAPHTGDDGLTHFTLPALPKLSKYSNQKEFAPFDIGDWCEFMGWWLSEGSIFVGKRTDGHDTQRVEISQCPVANPENHTRIHNLLVRMGLRNSTSQNDNKTFVVCAKQFVNYFLKWDQGCYDKFIPDELFDAPVHARQRMFDALIAGDGTHTSKCLKYCSVSKRLVHCVERLAISLGYASYVAQVGFTKRRDGGGSPYYNARVIRKEFATLTPNNWSVEQYDGMVYCATVPGGFLYVRGDSKQPGYWTGNSEKAGVDARLATGVRIGSDGRLYQQFRNRRTQNMEWLTPDDLETKNVAMPK